MDAYIERELIPAKIYAERAGITEEQLNLLIRGELKNSVIIIGKNIFVDSATLESFIDAHDEI